MADRSGHSVSARILSHILVVALTLFLGADLAHAASAYIRVNQVGYAGSSTNPAYLMASGRQTGPRCAINNASGAPVFAVWVEPTLGAGESFPRFYALFCFSVSTAGTYTISVASPIAATSPAFKIDTAE